MWTPPSTPTLSEIPDVETPQVLMASIPPDSPLYDPELGPSATDMDYDVTDSMDYSRVMKL
jgi:hypothetical protein